jgi:pyruvate kinase
VESFYVEKYDQIDTAISESINILKQKGLIDDGDTVIHTGSTPLNLHGRTNMMKVSYV